MAKFTLHLCVEGFLAATGTGPVQDMLGRVVTVELLDPGGTLNASDVALLTPLLRPWEWQIGWKVSGTKLSAPLDPTLARPLDARLNDILTRCKTDPAALKLLRFRKSGSDPIDDAEEDDPIWPGFLAQLGRLGPQITHPLGLSYVHQLAASVPTSVDIAITTITVGGKTYTVGDTSDPGIELVCPSEIITALAPGHLGLIEPVERLVQGAGSETVAEWLSELPVRLGSALDPLARLADIRDVFSEDHPYGLYSPLRRTLESLFWQPSFRSIMLSIIDACSINSGQDIEEKGAAATKWAGSLSTSRDKVILEIERLFTDRLKNDDWCATDFRNVHASSELDRAVLNWLNAAWPPTPAYDQLVLTWLESPSNAGVLLRRIFPETLATTVLQPALMEGVYKDKGDWEPLKRVFVKTFIPVLLDVTGVDVGAKKLEPLAERLKAIVFELRKEGVDIGARDGVPFRVDTVFGETTDDDLHLLLDGYIAAIATRSGANYSRYELVSRGTVTFETVMKRVRPSRAVSEVTTALPVTFEVSRSSSSTKAETRHAIACYRGEPLIPWSNRGAAELQPKNRNSASIEIVYEPNGSYPTLAYGRDYRIAVGYPAPGGILPMGFAKSTAPITFDPDPAFLEANIATPRFVEIEFRRTLAPSAPRLVIAEADSTTGAKQINEEAPLATAGPMDKDVRPLWKEHVERWSGSHAKARDALRDASTIFLDGCEARSRAFPCFLFAIKASALALGANDANATNARLWQYWRERDADGGPPQAVALKRSATNYVDDPAVVGPVRGSANNGGVELVFQQILATGPGPIIATLPIPLAERDTIFVRLQPTAPGGPAASMALQPPSIAGQHDVFVTVPPGTRWSLSARTMCDTAFFKGGADWRFGDFDKLEVNSNGTAYLFGTAALVIEALPEADHLPPSDLLWQCLRLKEDALGSTIAQFADPTGPVADARADYIGSIRTTRQTWRWDGGPVLPHAEYKIAWNESELDGTKRSNEYLAFEKAMFVDRGTLGTQETVQHVSGTAPKLFSIEHGINRGGNYLRASMIVTSRYAPFRAQSDPDGTYLRRIARLGDDVKHMWRGRLIGPRRRDPLPTPRVGMAGPSFGTAMSNSLAGGVNLYLDHLMYDPTHGGGLAEVLEVRVMVDTIDRLLDASPSGPSADGKTASLATGLDATLHTTGDPYEPYDPKSRVSSTVAFEKGGKWGPMKPGGWSGEDKDVPTFQVSTVIAQTLEISSAAPRLNYAIAHIEPVLGGKKLLPNTAARIQVRCTAEGVTPSEWSAAMWVYFLPNSSAYMTIKGVPTPIFHATGSAREVKLDANAASGAFGLAALGRLVESIADAPGAGTDKAYLARGVWAVLVRMVRDIRGDDALRVIDVVRGRAAPDGSVRFDLRSGQEPSFLRILEVQHVNSKAAIQPFGLAEATERLFGSDLAAVLERKVEAGASPDIAERIVGVGPLVPIL